MNNLATKNKNDFTVTENGDAFISQTAVAKLCGVGQNSISQYVEKTRDTLQTNSTSQLSHNSLELVIGHYAFDSQRTNDIARNNYRVLAKAGAKAYIYHESGYVMKAVQPVASSSTTQRLADVDTSITLLERLGMLDDRDRLYYADSIRNAGLPMLPASNEIFPVTISSRVNELHLKADSGELQKIGKFAAKLYLEKYDEPPVKHTQYVRGAARKVNSYTTEHIDIIDKAIDLVITDSEEVE